MRMSTQLSPIFPCLRYKDALRMIDWLVDVFGFEKHAVYEDGQGGVAHAELRFGSGMLMLGSGKESASEWGRLLRPQCDIGELRANSIYLAVDDLDARYERAKAAGAEILMEPTDQDYGSRDFICLDPEGNMWSFGTYWPKADEAPPDPVVS